MNYDFCERKRDLMVVNSDRFLDFLDSFECSRFACMQSLKISSSVYFDTFCHLRFTSHQMSYA